MLKICEACGKEFEAKTKKQRFCNGDHYKLCDICGKSFLYNPRWKVAPHTCSKDCKNAYKVKVVREKYGVDSISQIEEVKQKKRIKNASPESQEKMKRTCMERYGYERAVQSPEVKRKLLEKYKSPETMEKRRSTFLKHYGVEHVFASKEFREAHGCNSVIQKQETKDAIKKTLLERYGVSSVSDIPGIFERAQATRVKHCFEKYGKSCIFETDWFAEKMKSKFGVSNVSKSKEILSKSSRNKQNKSSLEIRLHNFLKEYNIDYIEEYSISSGSTIHSFDVFLPKYKILIDCDGLYWHSYKSDPDGIRVRDDGDAVRLLLVPTDHIFIVLEETDFERGLRQLQTILKSIDSNIFDYDTDLFNWCRSVGFPYYNYSDDRLISEWNRLCNFEIKSYNENCKICISIINQFHRSIYDAHTPTTVSPHDAWNDDILLKRVIANRLIYKNTVDPSKVLQGFNISKIATKVSVFNPILAKYVINKYLHEFDTIFDPFSGFSGRLLGAASLGKTYIGSDINDVHVFESNEIINFLNLHNCSVSSADVLNLSNISYDSLFTCPPYGDKEIYGDETEFKSCDEWIAECLRRFQCSRYVFVVDKSIKYSKFIAEELKSKSHFRRSSEYVVVIDKDELQ